jgi:hypothetical protein
MHRARASLRRHNKLGLLAALDTMASELMLLGVATLILLVVERNVAALCGGCGGCAGCEGVAGARFQRRKRPRPRHPFLSPPLLSPAVDAADYRLPTWLDFVDGCACCLAKTAGVSGCYLQNKGCASAAAIAGCCDALPSGANRVCPTPDIATYASLEGDTPHRRLLADPEPLCAGRAAVGVGGCPPGRRPAVSLTALHETHVFIFIMALTHIGSGAALIGLTSLRVRRWRRWDTQAAEAVKAAAPGLKEAAAVDKADVEAAPEAAPGALPTPTALSAWRQRPDPLTGLCPRACELLVCLARQASPYGGWGGDRVSAGGGW